MNKSQKKNILTFRAWQSKTFKYIFVVRNRAKVKRNSSVNCKQNRGHASRTRNAMLLVKIEI